MVLRPRTFTDPQTFNIHKPDQIEYPEGSGIIRPLDLAWLAGRANGKTTAAEGVMWRWARDYPGIFILVVKHERKSLAQMFENAVSYFQTCDAGMTFTKEPMMIRWSNGSVALYDGLQDRPSFERSMQGLSIGAMIVEEVGSFSSLDLPFYACSSLRGRQWPRCVWWLGNPGGRAHGECYDMWIDGRREYEIFETSAGRVTMLMKGTYQDNPFVDDDYKNALISSTRGDAMRQKMWLEGSWELLKGSLFGTSYSTENVVRWWPGPEFHGQEDWKFTLGYDDGQASPAWCGLFAEAKSSGARGPDLQLYRRNSRVLVAEYSTATPDDRAKGNYSTTKENALGIKDMCREWYNVRRFGYGDPMIFKADGHEQTLGHLFVDEGVVIEPAKSRARVPGWQVLKQYLSNAQPEGQRHDGDAALYVNEAACPQFIWELKNAMPDVKNPDDCQDSRDDALDGTRYYLISTISSGSGMTITSLER